MPITPLTLQRRLAEVGRIRIGHVVQSSNGKTRPAKLDRFRFTSPDRTQLERVAAAYGGTVREWTPANGGAAQYEVLTDASSVAVIVPPQALTQWMEAWSGGGCTRRCDGETEIRSDSPCLCAATDQMICKPTTRLSVLLRDIEGLGSWRLESHGWNAAAELPGMAELLARAGGYVQARLYLKPVRQITDGQTRDFMVPALAVDGVTPAQLLSGDSPAAAGITREPAPQQLEGSRPAIEQGSPDYVAKAAAAASMDEVRDLWRAAKSAGHMTPELDRQLQEAAARFTTSEPAAGSAEPADVDAVWQRIVATAGELGMELVDVDTDFAKNNSGLLPDAASAGELQVYLERLQQRTSDEAQAVAS